MFAFDMRCGCALPVILVAVSCAATAENGPTSTASPLRSSAAPSVSAVPSASASTSATEAVPALGLSPAEAAEAAALAARCGLPARAGRTYELTRTTAPSFDSVVGPIRLEVAPDVDFGRLASFMQGFIEFGAGTALVARGGGTEGSLLLLLESDYMKAPMVSTRACDPAEGVWQLHVRDRLARLQAPGAVGTWQDLSALTQRGAELLKGGVPTIVTLNATASTPVPLVVWALAMVACAAEVEDEMPPVLELGEQCKR